MTAPALPTHLAPSDEVWVVRQGRIVGVLRFDHITLNWVDLNGRERRARLAEIRALLSKEAP